MMEFTEYVKINTVFKRDRRGKIDETEFATPELKFLADNTWLWTEKVNGTNTRISYDGSPEFRGNEHAYVFGRSNGAQLPPELLRRLVELAKAMPLETVFGTGPDVAVTLHGEGYGHNIHGGHVYRSDVDFVLFDVQVGGWWLSRENVEDVATKLNLDVVPLVGRGTLLEAVEKVRDGFTSDRWENVVAEGLVMRPETELFSRAGERIVAKIKHKDFR